MYSAWRSWGFGRRNSQTLAEDADEIEHLRAVEQEEVIGDLLVSLDELSLTLPLDLEDVRDVPHVALAAAAPSEVALLIIVPGVVDVCPDDLILR